MTAKNTRRSGPPRRSGGGLIVGIFVGLLLGLAIALGVAFYLNKTPIPYLGKAKPEAGKDAKDPSRLQGYIFSNKGAPYSVIFDKGGTCSIVPVKSGSTASIAARVGRRSEAATSTPSPSSVSVSTPKAMVNS